MISILMRQYGFEPINIKSGIVMHAFSLVSTCSTLSLYLTSNLRQLLHTNHHFTATMQLNEKVRNIGLSSVPWEEHVLYLVYILHPVTAFLVSLDLR